MAVERCACGRPLHYGNKAEQKAIERLCAASGRDVPVRVNDRTWLVQRHYLALHGPKDLDKMKFAELFDDGVYLPFLYDEGGARISIGRPDFNNQVFSHIDNDDGTQRHFYIPKLQEMANDRVPGIKFAEFGIIEEHVQFVIANRGVVEAHINERLTNEALEKPGLMCEWADGSQLVVDGNHRYVARYRRGMPYMGFWIFPERVWRRSLLISVDGLTAV